MGKVKDILIDLMNEYPNAKDYNKLFKQRVKRDFKANKLKTKKNYGKEKTN